MIFILLDILTKLVDQVKLGRRSSDGPSFLVKLVKYNFLLKIPIGSKPSSAVGSEIDIRCYMQLL